MKKQNTMAMLPAIEEYGRYTKGDGGEILQDGEKIMSVDEVILELNKLTDTVAFYADPAIYLAMGFFPDPPCGDFIHDFSEAGDFGVRPGRVARRALGIDQILSAS